MFCDNASLSEIIQSCQSIRFLEAQWLTNCEHINEVCLVDLINFLRFRLWGETEPGSYAEAWKGKAEIHSDSWGKRLNYVGHGVESGIVWLVKHDGQLTRQLCQ